MDSFKARNWNLISARLFTFCISIRVLLLSMFFLWLCYPYYMISISIFIMLMSFPVFVRRMEDKQNEILEWFIGYNIKAIKHFHGFAYSVTLFFQTQFKLFRKENRKFDALVEHKWHFHVSFTFFSSLENHFCKSISVILIFDIRLSKWKFPTDLVIGIGT